MRLKGCRSIDRPWPSRTRLRASAPLLAVVAVVELGMMVTVQRWADPELDAKQLEMYSQPRVHSPVLLGGLVFLALWRVEAFNPALNARYSAWLRVD